MLLIRTRLAPSAIHGLGVFADEDCAAGQPLWRFEPGLDLTIPLERVETLPPAFRSYLDTYAYPSHDAPGCLVLSCDHAKFLNHSDDPNMENDGRVSIARRPIRAGDEITCDYRAFVVDWEGFA